MELVTPGRTGEDLGYKQDKGFGFGIGYWIFKSQQRYHPAQTINLSFRQKIVTIIKPARSAGFSRIKKIPIGAPKIYILEKRNFGTQISMLGF